MGIGCMDICQPNWFTQILVYDGSNENLAGFEQNNELAVGTPFVIVAIVGNFLHAVLPKDNSAAPMGGWR
jgi:hypothetical protein